MVIRMVLIGESGTGKSYAGNSILGSGVFPIGTKGHATTRNCAVGDTTRFGTKFIVVDTPGYFEGNDIDSKIIKTVQRCVELTHPGPQVFLFVFSCSSRYCENDVYIINCFKDYFGDNLYKHAVILFTQKNSKLCKGSITKFLRSSPKELRDLIELCGNRVTAIDNVSSSENEIEVDIRKLISIVVDLVNDRNLSHLDFDSVNNNKIRESNTPTNSSNTNHTLVSLTNSTNEDVNVNTKGNSNETANVTQSSSDTNFVIEDKTENNVNKSEEDKIPNPAKPAPLDDTKDKTERPIRRCLWYDCSDELTKQQLTVLCGELSQMADIKKQLTEEIQSTPKANGNWCKMADDGICMVTEFNHLINDIFRDEVNLLSPTKATRSLSRRGAVRISKHYKT